jgi:membrane associated rhomboid family serine protease
MPRFDDAPVTWIILIAWLGMAGLTGLLSPSSEALLRYGAAMPLLVPDEPWRLLAYSFLHHGFLHLAMNAIGFAWIAPSLEQALGGVRFVTLYVVSAVIGGVCGGLGIHPLAELAGGSGAVFGVFGAAIAMLMHLGRSKLEFLHYHGPRSLVTLIAANFAIGLMLPRVSNAAHLGGLIAGFVFVFVFCGRERAAPDRWTHVAKSAWLARSRDPCSHRTGACVAHSRADPGPAHGARGATRPRGALVTRVLAEQEQTSNSPGPLSVPVSAARTGCTKLPNLMPSAAR